MDTACECFNFVIVLGSVLDASSRSVAFGGYVDAALILAVEGRTLIHEVQHGKRVLHESGAKRVGLVLANPFAPAEKSLSRDNLHPADA
jgi:hypothetical protein